LKHSFPSTRAVQLLRKHDVRFERYLYQYNGLGNVAKDAAAALGVAETEVFKTLVFTAEANPLLVLIDAAHRVGPHKLTNVVGQRARVNECSERDAERYTGYKVGGISPFGTRRSMPIYLDSAASAFERIYVNGGSHGFMLSIRVSDLIEVLTPVIADLRS
jgi:Cys-tRNA(Pro) deacylase